LPLARRNFRQYLPPGPAQHRGMSGYLIADVTDITDPGLYERYQSLVPPSLRTFNGTYLARGGDVMVLEGSWCPHRLVIVRFESAARAAAWWDSDQYRDARRMRQVAAQTNMIVVEGTE
jgi:uncharacterized protein (DUF1330 family)